MLCIHIFSRPLNLTLLRPSIHQKFSYFPFYISCYNKCAPKFSSLCKFLVIYFNHVNTDITSLPAHCESSMDRWWWLCHLIRRHNIFSVFMKIFIIRFFMKHKTVCCWRAQYLKDKNTAKRRESVITFKSVKIKHHNFEGNFIRGSEKLLLNFENVQIFVE